MNTPPRQTNDMSDASQDGSRKSDTPGQARAPSPAEQKPPHDRGDQSDIEVFDEEGAGIAAKE